MAMQILFIQCRIYLKASAKHMSSNLDQFYENIRPLSQTDKKIMVKKKKNKNI